MGKKDELNSKQTNQKAEIKLRSSPCYGEAFFRLHRQDTVFALLDYLQRNFAQSPVVVLVLT